MVNINTQQKIRNLKSQIKIQENKFGLPNLGYGLGLRSKHFDYIIQNHPAVDWFEIITENFLNTRGRAREKLDEIRTRYPIVMHGVSLSVGSTDPLNMEYLRQVKNLAAELKPAWISDHLCWTGINNTNTHDLLPMPLTKQALLHTADRIKQVQDFLGRPLLLENPSSYLTFRANEMPEYEFMATLAEMADSALLLDVNNIYVASYNQRLDPHEYINALPANCVVQIHLAGHTNMGTHIVDTHDSAVTNEVWQLYAHARTCFGNVSTMIEWDGNIPEFPVLEAELAKAREWRLENVDWKERNTITQSPVSNLGLLELQANLQTAIYNNSPTGAETWVQPQENFLPEAQVSIYITAYRLRLAELLMDDYPKTAKYLGEEMKTLVREYIDSTPSTYFDAAEYGWSFADFITNPAAHELADIERKTAACFNLKYSTPAIAADFAGLSTEEFLNLNIYPQTASFLLELKHSKTHLCIYRQDEEIYQLPLEKEEFLLLKKLQNSKNTGEALGTLPQTTAPEKTQEWFGKWLANSLITIAPHVIPENFSGETEGSPKIYPGSRIGKV